MTDGPSAMPPIHHREHGVVGLLGDPEKRPYFGIIVDGYHSHPNTVRIAYGACREGCIVVTDGTSPFTLFIAPYENLLTNYSSFNHGP